MGEAQFAMQNDGALVLRSSDHGNHLSPGALFTPFKQRTQEELADAFSGFAFCQIDGVFNCVTISRAGAVGACVTVAQNASVLFRDKPGQMLLANPLHSLLHFLDCRRLLLKGGGAIEHVMRVYLLDLRNIVSRGITYCWGLVGVWQAGRLRA